MVHESLSRLLSRLFNEDLKKFNWPPRHLTWSSSETNKFQLWTSLLLKCPKLQSLDYTHLGRSNEYGVQAMYLDQLVIKVHPHLHDLRLEGIECIDNSYLGSIAKQMPNLRLEQTAI